MAQDFVPPTALDRVRVALQTRVANALAALQSLFSGSTAPSSPVAGQPWIDTSTGWLMVRNIGNSAWVKAASANNDLAFPMPSHGNWNGALSASKTARVAVAHRAGKVRRLVLCSSAATTSSSGNEWQIQLKKYPYASPGSPVNLFSGTVGTFTALAGVGGGAEMVANKAYILTPNQNDTLADLDVLELVVTKVGTATALADLQVAVHAE